LIIVQNTEKASSKYENKNNKLSNQSPNSFFQNSMAAAIFTVVKTL